MKKMLCLTLHHYFSFPLSLIEQVGGVYLHKCLENTSFNVTINIIFQKEINRFFFVNDI